MNACLSHQPQRLQLFLDRLDRLVNQGLEEAALLDALQPCLAELVSVDDWLHPDWAQDHPVYYQQHLIYADPHDRYSVVSFVWGPRQSTPIHDHTVWGLIGMLRGAEMCQHYALDAQGHWSPSSDEAQLGAGDVQAVSPRIGDVHKVWNSHADRTSISIHVYGANIGKVERSVYFADGSRKGFVSGYSASSLAAAAQTQSDVFELCRMAQVRSALLAKEEIALLDVREEDPFAQGHPLFAANLPLGRIEADAWRRIPRLDTPVVVYDRGEGLAIAAARTLRRMGYCQVRLLEGGLDGWAADGGELFIDVNVPSKSFGELVEAQRHTPSLPAEEVQELINTGADMVILDARRFDEYQTMCIPGGVSVPGAELALRARTLAPNPATRIVVNCAGRTRSIIGTQSLVNAGLPNPVHALRNGTIGWTLANQTLEQGANRQFAPVSEAARTEAAQSAQAVAVKAGVQYVNLQALPGLRAQADRSTYLLDVRTPAEFEVGHLPGALSAPGGQLVQETDHVVPVRGARIVVYDDDGVRACMSASWLAQMGWDVYVLQEAPAQGLPTQVLTDRTLPHWPLPPTVAPTVEVTAAQVHDWLTGESQTTLVVDLGTSARYVKNHLPGAWWLLRSRLQADRAALPIAQRVVLTCDDGRVSRFAAADIAALLPGDVNVVCLAGGTAAWLAAGYPGEAGDARLASPRIDRYKRPYEGTENARSAMQAYLDWEFGLVEQLGRDGTHGFRVI
jgi:predicted metal-dependent enzyme (double-stranded beta helix superfamily)/rhodanese-related sulfurtransferase